MCICFYIRTSMCVQFPSSKNVFIRLFQYFKERFPILKHGVIIAIFTFSAIGYSCLLSENLDFIPMFQYILGVYIVFTTFLLLRISDEFKDIEEDVKYRPYLPVPRGLVSLRELGMLGMLILLVNIALVSIFQTPLIGLYLGVLFLLFLMRYEFFIGNLLKHRVVYTLSHMFIIPALDLYASALDWKIESNYFHWPLLFFLAVSYCNGIVLEFGRKITTPGLEEEGVPTYSKLYGSIGAAYRWVFVMLITMILACVAAYFAGFSLILIALLPVFFLICSLPGFLFTRNPTKKRAQQMELFSGIWTALMYLHLGALPFIISYFAG